MKKVFILALKCILVLLPLVFCCLFSAKYMLDYVDHEAPYYMWNKEVCTGDNRDEYDVVILGDSVCNGAYAPEVFSDATVNLSLGGTTPVENYYVLLDYIEHNQMPKVVYMSFTDGHLANEDNFFQRIVYTHRFKINQLIEILLRANFYKEKSIIKAGWIKDFISYQLFLPNKYITAIAKAGFNQRFDKNIKSTNRVQLHRGRYISVEVEEEIKKRGQEIYSEFYVGPLFDEYYRRILDLCEEKGIAVRIVKTPMGENVVFDDEYERQFYAYYDPLVEKYENLTVDWVRGSYGNKYFKDSKHMNNRGARAFSETLESMYPDDFSEEISNDMYGILDDDVAIETDLSEVFQWIKGKEYTVLIYDGTGSFEKVYEDELVRDSGLKLYQSIADKVYYVSGENDGEMIYGLMATEEGYKVYSENGVTCDWEPIDFDGVGICVMDDRLGTQASRKNFEINESRTLQYIEK